MNVKNLFRKAIPLTVAAAFALSLGACKDKEQTVSKEDAYAQLKSALTSTTETKELSASILGKYTSKTPRFPRGRRIGRFVRFRRNQRNHRYFCANEGGRIK